MRKYDSKNKRNIGIIVGICIIFAVIFSYFLIKEIKLSKIKYELETSTVLFDADKNSILLNNVGTIKKKWNKKYYLTYEKEQYNIGNHVIAFNNTESSLYLYGQFYEVKSNSEVDITKEETILNNLGISRFYKVADRKYLIIDSNIRTEDESLKTTNYLIIELDKQGNAVLYNNSLNVKVFSASKILTTSFTFDIANELLIYENETVDLKKILGTTNEYKEPEKEEKPSGSSTGNNTGDNSGTGGIGGQQPGGNGTGIGNGGGQGNTGTGGNQSGDTNNDDIITDEGGTDIGPGEIINQTAYTSIIRLVPSTNNISIDYVIYDKLGEYLNTFVEIRSGNLYNKVHLSKSSTNLVLTNLTPGTEYELTFKYTHLDEDLVKEETIDTHTVTTTLPNITLTGTKVTSKKIGYKISVSQYIIESANLGLYINGEKQGTSLNINNNNLTGELNIMGIKIPTNALVELKLENIIIGEQKEDEYVGGINFNKIVNWSYRSAIVVDPEPENPNTPEQPAEPEQPDTPEEPIEPEEPNNPNPEEPVVPDTPTEDTGEGEGNNE